MSELIDLPIPAENIEAVVANLERIESLARLVMEFELPDEIEIAPVFEP
jgi:hypothetical protein